MTPPSSPIPPQEAPRPAADRITQLQDLEGKPGLEDLGVALLVVSVVLVAAHFARKRWGRKSADASFRSQVAFLALSILGVAAIAMNLPLGVERKDILAALGVVTSAAIALSSTSLLGNLMAGLMLRGVHRYRPGDTIRVGEHSGRVTERGLISTEIQTEEADLVELPNLFLAQNPVKVVRSQGTVVTATVSLGYDVPRLRVQELLRTAIEAAGLSEPFVQVVELGDFTVVYRAGGLLQEVKSLLTTRSKLRACMLDALHSGGVEIASPALLSRRDWPADKPLIPPSEPALIGSDAGQGAVENIAFEKADKAEAVEELRARLEDLKAQGDELGSRLATASEQDRAGLEAEAEHVRGLVKRLEARLRERAETLREE